MKTGEYNSNLLIKSGTVSRILAILLLLSTAALQAQYQDFRFEHITTDNGLSKASVTCILQDHQGFMWFGTQDGLNR